MAADTLIQKLQTFRPSAKEIKQGTGFTDNMVDDYLTIFENFVLLATSEDSIVIRVGNIETRLTVVEDDLGELTIAFVEHVSDDSAHGVSGNNVGTGNYCSSSTGGVVNLAALTSDATDSTVEVTSPDATASPAAYDQVIAQTSVTLVNELKADVTQLTTDLNAAIAQLNDLLAKQKTAKQMATT